MGDGQKAIFNRTFPFLPHFSDRSQTGEGLAPVGALGHKDPLSPSQAFVGVY